MTFLPIQIKSVTVGEVNIPLKAPFRTALRTVHALYALVVVIETHNGLKGYGEATATAVITGDLLGSMRAALDLIAPRLIGRDLRDFNALLRTIHQAARHHNSVKAALEIALFDLRAQQFGVPLYQLLGGGDPQIKTDVTISVNDQDAMVAAAVDAVSQGFDSLKIKVGGQSWQDDVHSVVAIYRAVGRHVALRLDANQGWTAKQAVQVMRGLDAAGLVVELLEQPVNARDLAGLKFVTDNTLTPVVADESVFDAHDALQILSTNSANLINVKLMKTGGISGAIEVIQLARLFQRPVMMSCMLEGVISVTAAAHLAVAHDDVVQYCDLDGPYLCDRQVVDGGMTQQGSWITLADAPGLGITAVHGWTNTKVYDV